MFHDFETSQQALSAFFETFKCLSLFIIWRHHSLVLFLGWESGWTQHPSTKRFCYRFFSSDKTWDEARSHCQNLEGELASVTSFETNDFLTTFTREECWIGGYTENGDTWQWTDGSPWGYTNWASGEPNNFLGVQDKLQFGYLGRGQPDNKYKIPDKL